jgi:hypothetical protein
MDNGKRKLVKESESVTRVVDMKTGFVETEKTRGTKVFVVDQEPPFVKLYLDDIVKLKETPKGAADVLYELIGYMPYANQSTPVIAINNSIKRIIAKKLSCSMGKIDHAITDLVKKGILLRTDVGLYAFNPTLFGRGEWKDIKKLRLEITYDENGKTFRSFIESFEDASEPRSAVFAGAWIPREDDE